jgi:hypothetical protein
VNWSRRSDERRRQIAAGADKSLFKRNAQRGNWGLVLLAVAAALSWIAGKVADRVFARAISLFAAVSFVTGFIAIRWAQMERHNLERADPKSLSAS